MFDSTSTDLNAHQNEANKPHFLTEDEERPDAWRIALEIDPKTKPPVMTTGKNYIETLR